MVSCQTESIVAEELGVKARWFVGIADGRIQALDAKPALEHANAGIERAKVWLQKLRAGNGEAQLQSRRRGPLPAT